MKLILFVCLFFCFGTTQASIETNHKITDSVHDSFDEMLQQYVDSDGNVDYKSFKSSEKQLDDYLEMLSSTKPTSAVDKNDQLAYWINLYNASTIKLILKNYPVSSITDIANGKPWDIKWIKVGSEVFSLNQIENEIIRPQFNEPRIHFAVNCAAKSCPPLYNKAWKGSSMEENLEKRANMFINDNNYNEISSTSLNISKIFEWYVSDFGDVLRYINRYSTSKIADKTTINYKSYNWKLNMK